MHNGEIKEFFIPKGALLLPNSVAIDCTEEGGLWQQPEKVIIERLA
jgi:hypothetical protein